MAEGGIKNPHDQYFHSCMQDIRVAKDFIKQFLPTHIAKVLNFNTLKLENSKLFNQKIKRKEADVLYSVEMAASKEQAYIYILCEHQSSAERLMAFRLVKYMFEIMDWHLAQKQTSTLPVIYPIVFYNGKARYNQPVDIFSLFADSQLAKKILYEPFQLIDVSKIDDELLKDRLWSALMTLAMKRAYEPDVLPYLRELLTLCVDIDKAKDGRYYITKTCTYLMATSDTGQIEQFIEQFSTQKELSQTTRGDVMTIGERLEAKGRAQGRAQGQVEKAREVASRLLEQGLAPKMVAQATELDINEVKSLSPQPA